MPSARTGTRASLALTLAAPFASAQQIWTVDADGPSDFNDIQAAVDAASNGDWILVEETIAPSSYQGFVVDGKGLVLQGRGDVIVLSANTFGVSQGQPLTVRNLAAGQTLSLRGMEFNQFGGYADRAATFTDCSGAVVVEDCAFTSSGRMVEVVRSNSVTFTRSSLIAPKSQLAPVPGSPPVPFTYDALIAIDSGLWLYDSELRGGDGLASGEFVFGPIADGVDAGRGLSIADSSLLASGSTFSGGSSVDAQACGDGASGGDGLNAAGSSTVRLLDCTTTGGGGGAGACGEPDGVDGQDVIAPAGALQLVPGVARSGSVSSPATTGGPLSLELAGAPGDLVIAVYALGTAPALEFSSVTAVLHLGGPLGLIELGPLPTSGQLSVSTGALGLPNGALGLRLAGQALFLDGQDAFEGGPTELLIVDPSL